MSRMNEMLQELLDDVHRFLLITLNPEILSTNALTRKEGLLIKLQHIRQEYPQLQGPPSSREATPQMSSSRKDLTTPLLLRTEVPTQQLLKSSPTSPAPYLEMQGNLKQPSPILDPKVGTNQNTEEFQEEYEVYDGDHDMSLRSDVSKTFSEPDTSLIIQDEAKRDVPEISAAELMKSDKHGFLEKKGRERLGGLLSPFQRRWCAIKSGVFYFFDNANDKRPKGHIDLTGYEARSSPSACKDPAKKNLCFELVCPGQKTYQFIALTPKDMKQWISSVERNSRSSNSGESSISVHSDNESSPLRQLPRLPLVIPTEKPRSNKPLPKTPETETDIMEDIYEALDDQSSEMDQRNNAITDEPVYEAEEIFDDPEEEIYFEVDSDGNEDEIEFKPRDWYMALWDHVVTDDLMVLSFLRGDLIRIVSKEFDDHSWWTGVLGEKTGLVPKQFLMEAYHNI